MSGPFEPPTPWSPPPGPGGVGGPNPGSAPQGAPLGGPGWGPSDSAPTDSTFGVALPAPPSAPEQRVTKGGGGGRWIIAVLVVLGVLIGLLLVLGDLGSSDDDVANSGADAESDSGSGLGSAEDEGGAGADPFGDEPDFSGPGGGGSSLPFRPDSVAVDDTSVWISDVSCGVVVQIDKRTEQVAGAVDVGGAASGVTIADGSVWVGTREQGRLVRLNPADVTVEDVVTVPGFALGLASTGNEVWATDPVDAAVYRVDAVTGELLSTVPVGNQAHHIAIGDGEAWVANNGDDTLTRIDLATDAATTSTVGEAPLHVEVGEGSAWVTNSGEATVSRVAEGTGEVEAVIEVGRIPHALAVVAGAVWVGTETNEFWRIDPATNVATQVEGAAFSSIDTAVDGTDIWVADTDASSVVRFDAAAGEVASVIDLTEIGDCETFQSGAVTPPLVEAV